MEKKIMTVGEAYELIGSNCMVALIMETTCEEWETMDEDRRMKLAKEYTEWFNA